MGQLDSPTRANPPQRIKPSRAAWSALGYWLVFGVVFSLLPIGFNAISLLNRSQEVSYQVLVGGGELFLIATMLCSGVIGELIVSTSSRLQGIRRGLIVANFIAVAITIWWFGDATAALREGHIDRDFIAAMSTRILLGSIIISGSGLFVVRLANS